MADVESRQFVYPCEERGDRAQCINGVTHLCDGIGEVFIRPPGESGWIVVCDKHATMYSDTCNKMSVQDFEKSLFPETLKEVREHIVALRRTYKEAPRNGQA